MRPCSSVTRRPTRVAANILLDVKQRLFWRRRPPVGEVGHDLSAAVAPERDETATGELLDLLSWAVEHGHLTRDAASLIAQTRVADVKHWRVLPPEWVCTSGGIEWTR